MVGATRWFWESVCIVPLVCMTTVKGPLRLLWVLAGLVLLRACHGLYAVRLVHDGAKHNANVV